MASTDKPSIDVSSTKPIVMASAFVTVEGTMPGWARFEIAARGLLEPLWQHHLDTANEGMATIECPTDVDFDYLPLDVPAAEAVFFTVACPKIAVVSILHVDDVSPTGLRRAAIRAALSAHKQRRNLAKAIAVATGLSGMPAKRVAVEMKIRASSVPAWDPPF